MRSKFARIVLAAALVLAICMSSVLADGADTREEMVYGLLSATGKVEQVIAVNYITSQEGSAFTDYGEYRDMVELSGYPNIKIVDDILTGNADGEVVYQGTLSGHELPWSIGVKYSLDGASVAADDIAGASGRVTITITAEPNDKADSVYFGNYMLQMSLTLPRGVFANVAAQGASVANGGDSRIVTGTAMPGKPLSVVIEADASGFECESVSFTAVPLNFAIDAPDMSALTEQLTTLTDAIAAINAASAELSQGMAALAQGASSMSGSYGQLVGSVDTFKAQLGTLTASSKEIKTALDTLNLTLNPKLEDGTTEEISPEDPLAALRFGISDLAAQYAVYNSGMQGYNTAFGLIASGASGSAESVQQLADGAAQLADGASALSGGMAQLAEQTALIPQAIETEISGILASFSHENFRPISFADARNGEVDSVQFIMRTQPIRVTPTVAVIQAEPEVGIWERFLNLFRD
ncbi:MAG: hypothetical protein LBD16_02540 [Oscillospiraceae bacterium]|jgi:X-X-X-Leu-X-X-Gly heptad repeat protein|nr:hypothetical protein [Oscillospiraceae bacterium]